MDFTDILRHYREFGYFELNNLLALTHEKKPSVVKKLHRWTLKGDLVRLKRGFYAFPEQIAKNPLTPERAANQLYKISYVTGLWRLNQLGLIPEAVFEITNATRNNPARFETPLGRFTYQHLSGNGFFGYETIQEGAQEIHVATPEKALLDFFWWQNVEWTPQEFQRWRIQDPWKKIDHGKLETLAEQWGPPRLQRAAKELTQYLQAA